MSRPPLWSAGLVAVALGWPALPTAAQPAAVAPPSPAELVRGLREHGMSDLALEYLKELEAKPGLPDAVKAELPLERAKCLIEAADDETDETVRAGHLAEAKEALVGFLKAHKDHPRAAEASLAVARLTSLEARAQLSQALRIEIPGDESGREAAIAERKKEAAKARPMFQAAADQFKDAGDKLAAKIKSLPPDSPLRPQYEQERIDAELARAMNQFSLADTYIHLAAKDTIDRSAALDKARDIFTTLAAEKPNSRVGWLAKAWTGEIDFEKGQRKDGEKVFEDILRTPGFEVDEGKRMVQFFQLRRAFLEAKGAFGPAEALAKSWLARYGNNRRARNEAVAARWYLGLALQFQAVGPPGKDGKPPSIRSPQKLTEAERLFRQLSQSDNDYSARATRQRMQIVRLMLGDADKPPTEYRTFEDSQMAALIQLSKLMDAERGDKTDEAEVKNRRLRVVALLERARDLADPASKETQADLTDVLIRLAYFYQLTDQPQMAAVLAESIARSARTVSNRAAAAGSLALVGYAVSSAKAPPGPGLEEARKADRDRSVKLAKFLEEKFPTDPATNYARVRLAELLGEEGNPIAAFDALTRVTPAYDRITRARLLEARLATQLLASKDSPLPENRRLAVFNRAKADLDKVIRPPATAEVIDVRGYVEARYQLVRLMFLENRVNPKVDMVAAYARAGQLADETLKELSGFNKLTDAMKAWNLEGWDLRLTTEAGRSNAVLLQARTLLDRATDPGKSAEAAEAVFKILQPILDDMAKTGPFAAQVAEVTKAEGAEAGRVRQLAQGVDETRRGLIVLGLKARVKQGAVDQAAALIDLLEKFGGSIEANVGVLQQLSGEVAGQILALRKEAATNTAKAEEAKALSDGFARFLLKVSEKKTAKGEDLPPAIQLFIGQSLMVVEDYPRALEALDKVPAPAPADLMLDVDLRRKEGQLRTDEAALEAAKAKGPAAVPKGLDEKVALEKDEIAKLKEKADQVRPAVSRYKLAVLYKARALREAATRDPNRATKVKTYEQADALLKGALGTVAKPGWALSMLDFRKELGMLYEARAHDEFPVDPKKGRELWIQALNEWKAIYTAAQRQVTEVLKNPPKGPNGMVNNEVVLRIKNAFYDAYFEVQRCLVMANAQLQAANPKALQASMEDVAKGFIDMEKANGPDINAEVRNRYVDLLAEVKYPDPATPGKTISLMDTYKQKGGSLFLTRAEAGPAI